MKIKELTVTAVIPTAQYANIQPSITVEVDKNEEYDSAKSEAMKHIAQFSQQYAEDGKALSGGTATVKKLRKMDAYEGDAVILFDKDAHAYCDEDGNVFQSGSQFAKQYEHEFNSDVIIPVYAKKFGVPEDAIKTFWRAKADASTTFGTALHQALETEGRFRALAEQLSTEEKPVTTGIHETLKPAVEAFFTPERLAEEAVYEPFVAHSALRRCGQIDRLVIVDREKKVCDIEDYKTNGDLYKQGQPKYLKAPYDKTGETPLVNQPISTYTLQLNFYRSIMEANGWTVRNLKVHHWIDNEWKTTNLDKVNV